MNNSRTTAAVALSFWTLFACSRSAPAPATAAAPPVQQTSSLPRVILPDGFAVQTEIAADDATREQGLMYRDQLADDRGMIFVFATPGLYPFWMKNTLIPLDMIWIDRDRKIVFVASNVPPCKADPCPNYGPGNAAGLYVLETAAGVAAKHGANPGAALRFEGLDHVIVH